MELCTPCTGVEFTTAFKKLKGNIEFLQISIKFATPISHQKLPRNCIFCNWASVFKLLFLLKMERSHLKGGLMTMLLCVTRNNLSRKDVYLAVKWQLHDPATHYFHNFSSKLEIIL